MGTKYSKETIRYVWMQGFLYVKIMLESFILKILQLTMMINLILITLWTKIKLMLIYPFNQGLIPRLDRLEKQAFLRGFKDLLKAELLRIMLFHLIYLHLEKSILF